MAFRNIIDYFWKKNKRFEGSNARVLNLIKDPIDRRDLLSATIPLHKELPRVYSLKEYSSKVKNQGRIGSCAAFAGTSAIELSLLYHGRPQESYSELDLYYDARKVMSNRVGVDYTKQDSGVYLRALCKAIKKGVSWEQFWSYDVSKYKLKPSFASDFSASYNKKIFPLVSYKKLYTPPEIMKSISSGNPVVLGINVSDDFMNNRGSKIRRPSSGSRSRGGHAILIVGYNEDYFEIQNSWGNHWKNDGFAWLSKKYISSPLWFVDAWELNFNRM